MYNPRNPSNTLTVSNLPQKVMFTCEFQGQISDGMWENSGPRDHWQVWCDLGWDQVKIDRKNIGRNFWAQKDNYNLNNSELIEIVGERMLAVVKIACHDPEKFEKVVKSVGHWAFPETLGKLAESFRKMATGPEYQMKYYNGLVEAGYTEEFFAEVDRSQSYTARQMREDVKGLRAAMKNYLH